MTYTNMDLEIEIEIHFDYQPYEPTTRHYPGNPEAVEINSISIHGVEVSEKVFDAIIEQHGMDIEQACFDELEESRQAYAEQKYDAMKEEKMLRGL